jgi:hypothetical protein
VWLPEIKGQIVKVKFSSGKELSCPYLVIQLSDHLTYITFMT